MKKLILRADGNSKIGLGHLYRLLAIREMLKDHFDCTIVTSSNSEISFFKEDVQYKLIPENIQGLEEVAWMSEKFSNDFEGVIMDGYTYFEDYYKALKQEFKFLMMVDDLADLPIVADVVLNHSPVANELPYDLQGYTTTCFGPTYSVLRPSFLQQARSAYEVGESGRYFVCFGGADFENLTAKVVEELLKFEEVKKVDVVLGSAFENDKSIFNKAQIELHENLNEDEMLQLMKSAEKIVVPSSTILFEAIAVKKPIFSGYFIHNQSEIYRGFNREKTIFGAGDLLSLTEQNWSDLLSEFINLDGSEMIEQQAKMIDGKAASRLVSVIKEKLNESTNPVG